MEEKELEKLAGEYAELWLSWVLRELSWSWEECILFREAVGDHLRVKLVNMVLPDAVRKEILDHFKVPR